MTRSLPVILTLLSCIVFLSTKTNVLAFCGGGALPTIEKHFGNRNKRCGHSSSLLSSPISEIDNNILSSSMELGNSGCLVGTTSSLLHKYREALDASPLQTKIITGCALAIVGDAIAQSRDPDGFNIKRSAASMLFDGTWRTIQHATYEPLIQICNGQFSANILNKLPFASMGQDQLIQSRLFFGAIEQTLVSQLVLIPFLYYPLFYAVTGAVQGLTIRQTLARARKTFIPLMKRNLLFWIPVQFCAFKFVKQSFQIPALTVCGLAWTIILSISAGNVRAAEGDKEDGDSVIDCVTIKKRMAIEFSATKAASNGRGGELIAPASKTASRNLRLSTA